MYQLTVSYAHPQDPEAFLSHYEQVHLPLAAKFPRLVTASWQRCETLDGSQPPHFVIAQLCWETKEDALADMGTDEGKAVARDLRNFAQAGVDMDFGELNPAR
ncbi:EthD family reductase [Calidifontibacter sp. DB0510]|uniref:EthD family reductase n=1 Tax=Metallococcus carri TaxID=1656884 RepID=A0A967B044_9MICO|nr:EthD family reductase [Metallococcus carri]NHN55612.1 EthD family reductase [Metallococcus carri]NOP38204.1 EthD family reductase [Calidifontibacter sp. DB2511S]